MCVCVCVCMCVCVCVCIILPLGQVSLGAMIDINTRYNWHGHLRYLIQVRNNYRTTFVLMLLLSHFPLSSSGPL